MSSSRVLARRILVVDDEPLVCESVEKVLAFDGHKVETATSSEAALAIFEKEKFDLVILDYEMPTMRGDKLAVAIKALAPNQPIIMITAHVESLLSSGNPLAGVDLVIGKPFDLQEFRQGIARLLTSA